MATESSLQAAPSLRELVVEPPLFRTFRFSDEIVVLRMQYGPFEGSDEPQQPETRAALQGRERVDRLNVCDTRDEAAHDYEFASSSGNVRFAGAARVDRYGGSEATDARRLADAGRAVRGHERFTVSTRPGRDLLVVLRTSSSARANIWSVAGATAYDLEFPDAVIGLFVNGEPAGTSTFRPRSGWDEVLLKVDKALVSAPRTTLELRGRYASFRYWIYQ
jgi:hypothetical protein